MSTPAVQVGVGVCVVKNGKVLIGQRGPLTAHGRGTWSFPGGKLDYGETWADCARRETLEEAGITLHEPTFITCTNDFFEAEGKHFITLYMRADWASGEPQDLEPGKMANWKWCDWDKLPTKLFSPFINLINAGFKP